MRVWVRARVCVRGVNLETTFPGVEERGEEERLTTHAVVAMDPETAPPMLNAGRCNRISFVA